MRPTDHTVVALVSGLAVLDLQHMAVASDADVVLVAAVQLLRALVPGQGDLWVVDLDLTLKHGVLVGEGALVGDVIHHSDRLQK